MSRFSRKKYDEIIRLLQETDWSYTKIGKKVGSSSSQVKRINDGDVKNALLIYKNIDFPVRETRQEHYQRIKDDYYVRGISVKELSKKYNTSIPNVYRIINLGREVTLKQNEK